MKINDKEILDILVRHSYITQEEEELALKELEKGETTLLEFFVKEDILTKDLCGQALAESFKTVFYNLEEKTPSSETVLKLPLSIARKHNMVLIKESKDEIDVATSNITNTKSIITDLNSEFKGKKIKIYYSFEQDIDKIFGFYKKSLDTRVKNIVKNIEKAVPEIFNEIVEEALNLSASDIHFEPQEDKVIIRFRIDGMLNEVGEIQPDLFENILNKIKVQSNLRLDEHFKSQDGAIRMNIKDEHFDLRISVMPTVNGQNVVIRILSKYIRELSLSDLGLSQKDEEILELSYKKPFGMILTTGPTGSGKTTTLYSIIKKLQNPSVNITTIEDPVEYKIQGINQIQVNLDTNVTFAKGLRSIVRQDPNIILVGEIRDNETAEISVNAALTGHLVLSTFHANDAATAIPRLIDMGVEPFLLASTLNLILAQRLVRRVCTNCRHSKEINVSELKETIPDAEKYFRKKEVTIYEAAGCSSCNYSGYKGRIGIFESIYLTPELRDLILKNPSRDEVKELSIKQGARTFFEDGIEKVITGITTIEELIRVAPLDFDRKKVYGK